MTGGLVVTHGQPLPSSGRDVYTSEQVTEILKTLQTTIKQQQQTLKHQGEEISTLRDAVRKATAAPIWTAPTKDEDM